VTQDTSTKKTGSFMIAAACMFILGFASTWGPVRVVSFKFSLRVERSADVMLVFCFTITVYLDRYGRDFPHA
jgi:hypothetical protein